MVLLENQNHNQEVSSSRLLSLLVLYYVDVYCFFFFYMFKYIIINSNWSLTCAIHRKVLYKDGKTNFLYQNKQVVQSFSRMLFSKKNFSRMQKISYGKYLLFCNINYL